MIGYIIEKSICNDYAHGVMTLTEEDGKPKTFTSEDSAMEHLKSLKIPAKEIAEFYNIRPCIV